MFRWRLHRILQKLPRRGGLDTWKHFDFDCGRCAWHSRGLFRHIAAPRDSKVILQRSARLSTLLTASALIAACGGGKGSAEPAPTGVVASAGDQSVAVSWNSQPNIQYWVFIGPPGTTPENFSSTPGAYVEPNVNSPYTFYAVTFNGGSQALINGKQYSITVNARSNGGPGGPGSPGQVVLPRAAGASWQAGSALVSSIDNTADALFGASWGLPLYPNNGSLFGTGNPADFVFVGHNGSTFYSTSNADGQTYTLHPVASGVPSGTDLTAVSYGSGLGFLAVGTNGQASFSYDGISWTPQATGTTRNFRAIGNTASAGFIAVGDGCMVYATGAGGSGQVSLWIDYTAGFTSSAAFAAACASGTPPSLHAAGLGGSYVLAAGSQGTLAFSASYGSTTAAWLAAAPAWPSGVTPATVNLNSLTYGVVYETQSDGTSVATPLWVVVGDYTDAGSVVRPLILYTTVAPTTVNNAVVWNSWVAATLPAGLSGSLHAVTFASDPVNGGLTQLIAAGDNGMILRDPLSTPQTDSSGNVTALITSVPAQTWTLANDPSGTTLRALAHGNFGLQAVGDNGTRVFSY